MTKEEKIAEINKHMIKLGLRINVGIKQIGFTTDGKPIITPELEWHEVVRTDDDTEKV